MTGLHALTDSLLPLGTATSLGTRFQQVCARFPERAALTVGAQSFTYRELRTAAELAAGGIAARGAGPGTLVAICLQRGADLIVAMLAVTLAGAAYLPIDPTYPEARIAETLADSSPALVIGQGGIPLAALAGPYTQPDTQPADDAYVIYTSGSTGRPKGVIVTHHNVLRLLSSTADCFSFDQHDVWTMFHSFAFDFSVWEIWGCLLSGGRLVIVPFAVSRCPEDFYRLLIEERVTVLNQTPSAFRLLDAVDAAAGSTALHLRLIIFGGEALLMSSLQGWFSRHDDRHPRLINMYGITETTVHVTYRPISTADAVSERECCLGEPIPDLRLHLLDANLLPVPAGEEGEICVAGPGVARGYLNRPQLTAERFVADPLGPPGARLYRSGDMARRRADGELIYLGRRDSQVKVAGFRVELGEVEAALTRIPGVAAACVLVQDQRLVAFLAAGSLNLPAIRASVGSSLPASMRPSLYHLVPALPLTVNGKIDRDALLALLPGNPAQHPTGQHPTASPQDQVIAAWASVLHTTHFSADDNFFDVGGTSLLLIALRARLQDLFAREIPLVWLFECTTPRAMAQRLSPPPGTPASPLPTLAATGLGTTGSAHSNALRQKQSFAQAREARSGSR